MNEEKYIEEFEVVFKIIFDHDGCNQAGERINLNWSSLLKFPYYELAILFLRD